MNKEIIHQAAQAHAEKSFIQPLNAQGEVMLYLLGIQSVRLQKALQIILKHHFKAGVLWYQEQQLKPAASL
jgi:hypothetical protein